MLFSQLLSSELLCVNHFRLEVCDVAQLSAWSFFGWTTWQRQRMCRMDHISFYPKSLSCVVLFSRYSTILYFQLFVLCFFLLKRHQFIKAKTPLPIHGPSSDRQGTFLTQLWSRNMTEIKSKAVEARPVTQWLLFVLLWVPYLFPPFNLSEKFDEWKHGKRVFVSIVSFEF